MLILLVFGRDGRYLITGRSCTSVYDPPDAGRLVFGIFAVGQHLQPVALYLMEGLAESGDHVDSLSFGRNSDSSGGASDDEVQSSYKGPLDALEALEGVLPVKYEKCVPIL